MRVLIADDHPILLEGLAALLESAGHEVVARCTRAEEVPEALERSGPELLLLDIHMPGEGGLGLLRRLATLAQPRAARVVLLTSDLTDEQAMEAISLGADGLVLKESPPELLLECIREVTFGCRWVDRGIEHRVPYAIADRPTEVGQQDSLTRREAEVATLVLQGLRNKQIAERLEITEGTVKVYLHTIYQKLGVSSRLGLAARIRG